jgi:hypothetical protein
MVGLCAHLSNASQQDRQTAIGCRTGFSYSRVMRLIDAARSTASLHTSGYIARSTVRCRHTSRSRPGSVTPRDDDPFGAGPCVRAADTVDAVRRQIRCPRSSICPAVQRTRPACRLRATWSPCHRGRPASPMFWPRARLAMKWTPAAGTCRARGDPWSMSSSARRSPGIHSKRACTSGRLRRRRSSARILRTA